MANPFRKLDKRAALLAGLSAGIAFCIPVFFYIQFAQYRNSWLIYLGCFLFFAIMWMHTLAESKKRGNNESSVALIFAAHVATVAGILVAVCGSFALLSIMIPGYLTDANPSKTLTGEPTNVILDKTNGLSFQIFLAATFINFSVGSFSAIVLSFTAKRDQKKDNRDPAPLHQQGQT